jgi:hypothetical protein
MRTTRRRLVVAGAWVAGAVLGAATLTGVAMAADGSSQPAASSSQAAAPAPQVLRLGGGQLRLLRRLGARVLHGQLTIRTRSGVRSVDTQLGVVRAVTSTSLTVGSADGFSMTWALGPETKVREGRVAGSLASLAVGQTVRLLGPTSAGGADASYVLIRPAGAAAGGGPAGRGSGGSSAAAAPTTTA